MKALIEVKGIKCYAYHGFYETERKVGQWYITDVEVQIPVPQAVESDVLDQTLDYTRITAIVQSEMQQSSRLIEHVAGRIAKQLEQVLNQNSHYKITIKKLQPPVNAETEWVSFTLSK
jgi:dihydroneopterin aldolase